MKKYSCRPFNAVWEKVLKERFEGRKIKLYVNSNKEGVFPLVDSAF